MRNRFLFVVITLAMSVGTMYGATAAKGVFTVAEGKTVQFAKTPETDLVQWSTASAWSEEHATEHGGWYVLNHEEWTYLLVTRDGEGTSKNNLGTVNGQKGLVILPDEWSQPEGTTYTATPWSYTTNVYTAEEWSLMADAGAVFLPCKGYSTDGETIIDATDHGRYWASDEYDEDKAYNISMEEGTIHNQNNFPKGHYYSVILARDATITELDEEDDAATFATKLAAADDHDYAYVRRTLKKDGTLYTLCLPFDVPDIDDSPLAGAEVFTFDGGRVGGVPGNEQLILSLSRLNGKRLTQGVPYLLQWTKTAPVETLPSPLYFANVENWDTNTTSDSLPGSDSLKLHGVYPKTHIPDYTTDPVVPHYNFFLGANNTLYWPDKTHYAASDMRGFRAYFYIIPREEPGSAPVRGMQAVWKIEGAPGSATGIQSTDRSADRIQTEKLLRDGKVILVIDGKEFDLQGKQIK